MIRKLILASVAGAALAVCSPVLAQNAMTVGAQIKDPQGGAVGTVTKVDGEFVIVKTDRHEVRLPTTSFTAAPDGYLMGMTQAELNAAVDKSLAEAAATMTVGATVRGSAGTSVGTIDAIDAEFVTLTLAEGGQKIRLPRAAIAGTPEGPVIGMTAEQLKAQVSDVTAE